MRVRAGSRRKGISEIMGTLLMIAITLVAGAAVLGWINGQAKTSESAYGASAANNVNFLKERFVAESQTFFNSGTGGACSGTGGPGNGCTGASFYLYNNGAVAFTLVSIQIVSTNTAYPLNIIYYSACLSPTGCSNPSNTNREVVTQAYGTTCSVSSPCYPSIVYAGTSSIPTGFYLAGSTNNGVVPSLPISSLSTGSNGPYTIALPLIKSTQVYMYDTVAYTITFTGLFGNTVQETITANG